MTNVFEKSMQSVDPSVSLPYWDFTIESANGTALWNSPIFAPEVFGSMPNCSDTWWGFTYDADDIEAAAIPDGRWAFIEAPWNTEYPDLLYGYGYMRAPWSMNPSKYVSRFTSDWQIGTTLPRCSSHYDMLSYTSLMDFLMDAGMADIVDIASRIVVSPRAWNMSHSRVRCRLECLTVFVRHSG
jgi:hypothetical protein